MLLLYFLLVQIVYGAPIELTTGNYVLTIENNILTSIETAGESSSDLNLSSLGLRNIDKNVFDNLGYVKNLNLCNNSLSTLPEFVFSNLTSLEYLSLADNAIEGFKNAFVGLNNLKCLNISNNPIRHLRKSYFFGFTNSTDILTLGDSLFSISTGLFENPFLRNNENVDENFAKDKADKTPDKDDSVTEAGITKREISRKANTPVLDKSLRVKICESEGIVSRLEVLTEDGEVKGDCREVKIDHDKRAVLLNQSGICRFESGWYRLQDYPVNSLDISGNDIVDVSAELLNDLPKDLKYVNLADNKIERLVKGRIDNPHLRLLNFKNNCISEIEDGALENTRLSGLFLLGNRLKHTRFAFTLPDTIKEMIISQNQIQELSAGSFARLNKLVYFNLGQNNVTEINSESLSGLSSLQVLIFVKNGLRKIQPGSFKDLKALRTLYLYRNNLTSIEKGTFDGLESVKDVSIAFNQLTTVTRDSLHGLPDSLAELHLDFNKIESLQTGTFANVPKIILSLDSNKISKIEGGSFNLPSLHKLHLRNNLLSQPDGESFQGLRALKFLALNGNGITRIEKGIAKNLGGLFSLDLSENPITRLENGALFGLPKATGGSVDLTGAPIEVIQGGLFDNV